MGFDFGSIVRGVAGDITGYEEGKRQRAKADRQARMDLIRESLDTALKKAQIENYRSEAAARLHPKPGPLVWADDPNDPSKQLGMRYNNETGGYEPVADTNGQALSREKPTQLVSPGADQPIYGTKRTPGGIEAYPLRVGTPPTPARTATPSTPGAQGPTAQGPQAGVGRVLTKTGPEDAAVVKQRRGALARAQQISKRMTELETRYAQKGQGIADEPWQTTLAPGLGKVPGVGPMLASGAARVGQSQLSADQAEYKRLKQEYGLVYLQSVPQGARALAMQQLTQGIFSPSAGTKLEAYPTYTAAREASLAAAQAGLGQQAQETPTPHPQQQKPSYNPKFWPGKP